jgi:nucleotide-binding universal stress UspA family protein
MSHNILVPVDLQHESSWRKALPVAAEQAKHAKAKLHIMTVVPDLVSGIDWRYAIRGEMHGSEEYNRQEFLDQAKQRLRELLEMHVAKANWAEPIVRHGTVYKEIVEAAQDIAADSIIMASHRPSLKDYLLGPNTARVARHADCSVTIVRE